MKSLVATLVLLFPLLVMGQLYKSESSRIHFFSEAPLEDIEAENKQATGVIKPSEKKIAIVVPIKGFKFEKALMEEHFNENYMESDTYKNGTFVGVIEGDINWKKDGEYKAVAKGKLKIHGVEQDRELPGTLIIKDGKIILKTKFQVKLVDHDIEIPTVVIQNIAEVIDVDMEMVLAPKQ